MGFLNSFALWSGLAVAGVAVPIIIHLLYRKHRQQTDWAAMELLRRALVVRSGQVKLEDLLILLLRCAAILLIAAALLRPTLNSDAAGVLGEKRVGMVVAIDASYSMNHGEHSRFEKAIARTRKILENAREGDPVSLVLMSNRPRVLLRRGGYEPGPFEDALDELEDPSSYGLNLESNSEHLAARVAELTTPVRECFLVTDAQELDWASVSTGALESLQTLTQTANVFVVPIEVDGENNMSLTRLEYESGSLRKGGVARFSAEVRNQGRRPADGGTLEFSVGGDLITRRTVGALKAGEPRTVSFFASFANAGDVKLRAGLSRDELTDDNVRHAVVEVVDELRVLCVDGDLSEADTQARTGAEYAVKALQGKGGDTDGAIRVIRIPALDLSLEKNIPEFDVILLVNVPDLAPEMVTRLLNYVRGGGGLVFFLGDRVDPKLYNERFRADENGLLPAELVETVTCVAEGDADTAGWARGTASSDDSLARLVGRLSRDMVDSARLRKIMKTRPSGSARTLLSVADLDGAGSLAPLLLSRSVGEGTVLMFTTSADRSWGELPVHPLYAMLLQQAATSLSSRPGARQLIAGQWVELTAAGRRVGDSARLTAPSGETTDLRVTAAGERAVYAVDVDRVGVYEIAAGSSPGSGAKAYAANVDTKEAGVRVVDAGALTTQLAPIGVRVVAENDDLRSAIEDGRAGRELSRMLLILGVIAFVAQSILAKRFTDKMSKGETANVSDSLQMSRVAAARRT